MSRTDLVIRSPFGSVPIPEVDYFTALEGNCNRMPEKIALVNVKTGRRYCYREVLSLVERLASNLRRHGVGRGDTLAVLSPNSVEYILVVCSVLRLAGKVALISALSTAEEARRCIDLCDCSYLYTTEGLAKVALDATENTTVKKVFVAGEHAGCVPVSSLYEESTVTSLPDLSSLQIRPDRDVMAILFSSGTTGLPKGVMVSHRNCLAVSPAVNHPSVKLTGVMRPILVYQPMSHSFGFSLITGGLVAGNPILVVEKFHLKTYLAAAAKYKIECLLVVPPIAVMMAKSPLLGEYDLSCVKEIQNGGAPLKADTEREVLSRLPNARFARQGYGLTETMSIVCGGPFPGAPGVPPHIPWGSVGMLLPNTEARVIGTETGRCLGPDEDGELLFRGPQVMLGYMKNPEATATTVDPQGWIHTGDIGHYDSDGFFFVVDRLKELIKYKAYQVAPAELEAVILSHPQVEDVGVVGLPDRLAGELPHAWVTLKPGQRLTEDDLHIYVNGKVSPYKRLRGGVKFVSAIPKSPSGKILRRLIRSQISSSKL